MNDPTKGHPEPTKSSLVFFHLLAKAAIVILCAALFAFFLYLPVLFDIWKYDKTLNVYGFAETFTPEAIARFEKATGIKVNMAYAEADEQIYAKFRINEGEGYDVVYLSDFMVQILADQGMLHPLDLSLISNLKSIDSRLLNREFDRGNQFSIPNKWYMYGIVYDKKFFSAVPKMTLDYLFTDPESLVKKGLVPAPYKVCMVDDARDAVLLADIALFGDTKLDDDRLAQIKKMLVKQKKWVEAYTVHSVGYFLFADIVPIALSSSGYMRKILKASDRFDFVIPENHGMLVIENLSIPKPSKKIELAHQFINFMISDSIATINSSFYGYNSSNMHAHQHLEPSLLSNVNLFPNDQVFKKLHTPLLPPYLRPKVEEIWLEVGFAR